MAYENPVSSGSKIALAVGGVVVVGLAVWALWPKTAAASPNPPSPSPGPSPSPSPSPGPGVPPPIQLYAADSGRNITLKPGQALAINLPPVLANTAWFDEGGMGAPIPPSPSSPLSQTPDYPSNGEIHPTSSNIVNGTTTAIGQQFSYVADSTAEGGPTPIVLVLRQLMIAGQSVTGGQWTSYFVVYVTVAA